MKNKYGIPEDSQFSFGEIKKLFSSFIGKTLGEADKKNVFEKAKSKPKITGIAGDVVEQSILGYKANSDNRPDILVDGEPVEVKTTGIRFSKKKGKKIEYEAKEPMSITAVSPETITKEDFYNSHFWAKIQKMLFVYYFYDSDKPVKAMDYAKFYLKGYELFHFSDEDLKILKNDWETIKKFLLDIQTNYDDPKTQYPRLSSELRDKLMYLDTAPKWPKPPRIRFKRSLVTQIVQQYFNGSALQSLPQEIDSFVELNQKLEEITTTYKGKTVKELADIFNINIKNVNRLNKAMGEKIVLKMFGSSAKKINQIDIFSKAGIIAKTICLTQKGGRTEDMKLLRIDFDEICDENVDFNQSTAYEYFRNNQFLCIIFNEKDEKQEFKDNRFVGFKRVIFSEDFIQNEVQSTWLEVRRLILNHTLKESFVYSKKSGTQVINKTGVPKTSLNFPKSKKHIIFVRGSGLDSTVKPHIINDIHMYEQWLWIKGDSMVEMLKDNKKN